ncbi:hypothetical protein JCM33774_84760 [Actinophytocola sp. KF-1]
MCLNTPRGRVEPNLDFAHTAKTRGCRLFPAGFVAVWWVSLRGVLAGRAGLRDGGGSGTGLGWQGLVSVGACHPVDLPPGYHTASRGPGGLGAGLGWVSGPLDPV